MRYILEDRWLHIETESLFVKTIQEFFDSYVPSRKIQHLLIQNKHILLDGNPVKREDDIAGMRLSLCIYPETSSFEKTGLSPDIVYEDEIMAIVNKPKDLLVHSDGSGEMTLNRIVESYYSDRNDVVPLPIHRLDKETSGLVIYSKSPEGIETVPRRFAINYRNKWMLNNSDIVVTYVTRNFGGAWEFKQMADKQSKDIIELSSITEQQDLQGSHFIYKTITEI